FARIARASGRPVILVANKCEGRTGTEGFYEAFQLGLGEPVAISAEHGEGLVDLLDDAAAALGLDTRPKPRGEDQADAADDVALSGPPRPIRVAIVGR